MCHLLKVTLKAPRQRFYLHVFVITISPHPVLFKTESNWNKWEATYLCHFSAPRPVTGTSRGGRCGRCCDSLLHLWCCRRVAGLSDKRQPRRRSSVKSNTNNSDNQKNPNKTLRRVTRASSRRRWRRSRSVTPKPHEHAEHCCHRPAGVSWRAVTKQTPLPPLRNLLARLPSCLFSSVFHKVGGGAPWGAQSHVEGKGGVKDEVGLFAQQKCLKQVLFH